MAERGEKLEKCEKITEDLSQSVEKLVTNNNNFLEIENSSPLVKWQAFHFRFRWSRVRSRRVKILELFPLGIRNQQDSKN